MNRINNLLFALLATALFLCSSRPTQLFVASNGSDTNGTGSINQPFASPERARVEIRAGLKILLKKGVFTINA
jgi:hypothetical protein